MNIDVRGLYPRLAARSTVLIDGIQLPFAPYGQPQLSFAPVMNMAEIRRRGGPGGPRNPDSATSAGYGQP